MQQTSFIKDYTNIFNSLERMAKGTCGGLEGDICTWELMPRIQKSLTEHIAFEEIFFYPLLDPEKRKQHKLEHERLLRMLAKTSYEFECGYGEQLTVMVRQLIRALRDHLVEIQEMAS